MKTHLDKYTHETENTHRHRNIHVRRHTHTHTFIREAIKVRNTHLLTWSLRK